VIGAVAGEVDLTLQPGRCWADGLLVHLEGPAPVARRARYLAPPVAAAPVPLVPGVAGLRDAVVLDVWREALSAFQDPDTLFEPALGGPDTTERLLTSFAFRLLRLAAHETCTNISGRLDDNLAARGRLTVTLQPVVPVGPVECPVVDLGGYVGFEHNLYRIEIAELPPGQPAAFKWSQYNGGLVGRAEFDAAALRARIHANLQPIVASGLTDFYLETRELDPVLGYWRTTYAAPVVLNNLNELVLPAAPAFGAVPPLGRDVFFRLWNGLRPIADFPVGAANPLVDGIRLEFEAPGALSTYTPEDFWNFTVRADGIPNALIPGLAVPTLLDNARPEGIRHHRVPLAVLEWDGSVDLASAEGTIEDCREVFPPLTRVKSCCTFRVGDGMESFGDFDSIQEAVDRLPPEGGEICLLPGTFEENVLIASRSSIRIHGCGNRSRVVAPAPAAGAAGAAAIRVLDSRSIALEMFAVEGRPDAPAIDLQSANTDAVPGGGTVARARDISLRALRVAAGAASAIRSRGVRFLAIRDCEVLMRDVTGPSPGIFVTGDDVEIATNEIRVRADPHAEGPTLPLDVDRGLGGLQIGGTSERVRIVDNLIQGGRGNGITLGSVTVTGGDGVAVEEDGWFIDRDDECNPCRPGSTRLPDPAPGGGGPGEVHSAGALYDIRIERNRIFDMGLAGIGVVAFFNLDALDEFVSVHRLEILGNDIRRCLGRGIAPIDAAMEDSIGYGAIQLADVSDCVIRENALVGNGPSHLDPVCGIYVLHAEGIDVTANRIVDNGARIDEPDYRASEGPRAGIHIHYAIAPTILKRVDLFRMRVPVQNGVPAVRVHDNIVSQPLGQALWISALGPVSVEGNQLTSQGTLTRSRRLARTFLAGTVFILDLGLSAEDYLQFFAFAFLSPEALPDFTPVGDAYVARPGIDEATLGRRLAGGNVMFADNQVTLDLTGAGFGLAGTSILIISLDDIAFEGNQCDCNLILDFVFAQAAVLGMSVRAVGNRFKEGRYNAIFSAVTFGVPMNATTSNQATHCIYAASSNPVAFLVFEDNRMRWGPLGVTNPGNEVCNRYKRGDG
jgi:hypothetical protein